MFGYRRTYSGKRRGSYSSTGPYRKFGSGSTARALGSARAAKKGAKVEYFNCTVSGNMNLRYQPNANYTDPVCFWPCAGGVNSTTGVIRDADNGRIYGGIVNDRSYRLKCANYDEVRLVSMRLKLQPTFPANRTTLIACTICDRDALRNEVQMDDSVMSDDTHDVPTAREIAESPGSIQTVFNSNKISPIYRTVYARDMVEKISYTDATIQYNATAGENPLATITTSTELAFSPAIYLTVKSPDAITTGDNMTWTYSVEYNVIFRNPKSDISTFINMENPSKENPEPDPDDDQRSALTRKYTVVKSSDPYIPDMLLGLDGRETLNSWFRRYQARFKHSIPAKPEPTSLFMLVGSATKSEPAAAAAAATVTEVKTEPVADEEEEKEDATQPMDL